MRFKKRLLQAILKGDIDKKFSLFIRDSEYTPIFLKMPFDIMFSASSKYGRVEATEEEITELKKYIDVKSISIGIEDE